MLDLRTWSAACSLALLLAAAPSRAQEPQAAPTPVTATLRVQLRWSGAGRVTPVVVTPADTTLTIAEPTAGVSTSGASADGATGEWLVWDQEPPAGRYVICAAGDAGAGTHVMLEVTRAGRTGRRDLDLSGALPTTCARGSAGFLTVVSIAPVSAPAAPVACAEGRVTVEGGYCCWPGQRFDESHGRCGGPPRCPAGYAAAGAECVATEAARPRTSAPPPRTVARGPAPTAAAATQSVHVALRSQQTGLSLHRLASTGPLTLIGPGFAATGQTTEYALISAVPGHPTLDVGTYQFAVALGQRNPIATSGPTTITSETAFEVSYEDRFPLNILGYVLALGGVGAGVGLTTGALLAEGGDVPMLVTGIISGVVGIVAGLVLINLSDVATLREVAE